MFKFLEQILSNSLMNGFKSLIEKKSADEISDSKLIKCIYTGWPEIT